MACARVFMSEVLILEKYEVKKGILPMNNVIGVLLILQFSMSLKTHFLGNK